VLAAPAFRSGPIALLRAVTAATLPVPTWPELDDPSAAAASAQVRWLRAVWAIDDVAEGLRHASPVLAAAVESVCAAAAPDTRQLHKVVRSVARYLLRAQHRPSPFGLFAGVTTATVAPRARVGWGGGHVVTARAGAEWLSGVIARLERCPDLRDRLPLVVNNAVGTRGDRLIVPYESDSHDGRTRAVEVSLALTAPVRTVLAATQAPVLVSELADWLSAEFPAAGADNVQRLIGELLSRRVLITNLHAPSTETDALGYLLDRLDEVAVDGIALVSETVRELRAVRAGLDECGDRAGRDRVAARMRALAPEVRPHPLALDVRLDAQLDLPEAVAREVERAAWALTRVCARPYGTEAWRIYHQRFYERYGIGTMVPLREVVADSGTGFPDGYPGAPSGAGRSRLSSRDDALLRIAQAAALDGRTEVVVTDELLADLDIGPEQPRVPPHLEVGVRVHAASLDDLQRGRFRLEVVSVSRGVGVSTGRFLGVLAPEDRKALAAGLADVPATDEDTLPAQLSFPPLLPASAHVTRAPRVHPTVISVAEHRTPDGGDVLTPDDLAVACDGRRMYLAAPERGHRVEAVGLHALNLRTHTPPLVRFLTELSRAQGAQVTTFDWGAASALPFLPRLRYGRTVLVPAQWRLEAAELTGDGWWAAALANWRERRRAPRWVFVVEDDRRLFLDLDDAGHRSLLRAQLDRAGVVQLQEAPEPDAYGWCEGRAHELVMPLKATRPTGWPPLPAPALARSFSPEQQQTPAAAPVLLAALYGDARRQDELLVRHLPELLTRLGDPPWWFIRFRDPDPHIRLRIGLPSADAFGETARTVSAWADELRAAGLLADLRYPTSYREMGRWGSGPVWDAAEDVFRTDSRAVLAQLREPQRPPVRALVTAHTVAITTGFLGSVEAGMRWLIDHIPATAPAPAPRPQFTEAVRLADPTDQWAALRDEPGGQAVAAWADRAAALAAYRPHLLGPHTEGIALDDVLTSLLHTHFVRHVAVNFPEEEICLYLARAAALAWTARTEKQMGTQR
jgi:thiopeptide-type bacteriocin biosynthesis protein